MTATMEQATLGIDARPADVPEPWRDRYEAGRREAEAYVATHTRDEIAGSLASGRALATWCERPDNADRPECIAESWYVRGAEPVLRAALRRLPADSRRL